MHDLIVLGGSISGVTAAIYATRRKLDVVLITPDFGGEIATTSDIENWPGENKISGLALSQKLEEQIKYNNTPTLLGQRAVKIEKKETSFNLQTENLSGEKFNYEAQAIIVATGTEPQHLNIPGEKEFFHKGVTYCATCDAPLFKNKAVAVIGGGNSALTSALMLGEFATQVFLLNVNLEFKGETVLIEKVKSHSKIKILTGVTATEILGEKTVSGLEYTEQNGEIQTLEVRGIFVHIGLKPNTDFIDFVEKTPRGEIKTDRVGHSSAPGILAAGDVSDVPYKQIIIAGGLGATAALAAIDYLNKN